MNKTVEQLDAEIAQIEKWIFACKVIQRVAAAVTIGFILAIYFKL